LSFCVYCGKKFDSGDKFCPFCGKQNNAQQPKQPINGSEQQAGMSQVTRPVPIPIIPEAKPQEPANKPKINSKLIGIGAASLAGALLVGAGVVFLPGLFDSGSKELEAFEAGARASCSSLPVDIEVSFSEFDVDDLGNPLIDLKIGNDLMQWKSSAVAGDVFLFEIDSIYGPSALRAQKFGCDLRFQAQP
jgi:hypothetical protein